MKRAILVHNPGSGNGRHSAEELTAQLRRAGFRVRYIHAKKRKEMKGLRDAKGLIVVAGGDGTVHRVARRIAGRDAPNLTAMKGKRLHSRGAAASCTSTTRSRSPAPAIARPKSRSRCCRARSAC